MGDSSVAPLPAVGYTRSWVLAMDSGLQAAGKMLIVMGVAVCFLGGLLLLLGLAARSGLPRLPGDIVWRRGNFTFHFPLATMLLLSLILTIVLNFLARTWRR